MSLKQRTKRFSETRIQKSIHIAADPDTVWNHLTQAELLGKWFHPATENLSHGEDYTLTNGEEGKRMCWGTVEEMTPKSYMRWSLTVEPMRGRMSAVEWHLSPAPGGARLTLEHHGLPQDAEGFCLVMALDKGWHGLLGNLQQV